MCEPPNIFMSYSLRGKRSRLVERVNKALKKLIADELNWNSLDPMDVPEAISIERKVQKYLLQSDAIILDNTENPNVAHEAGFAKAFGYPLIVIKCNSASQLPADFGDIEYRSYPDEVKSDDDLKEFLAQVRSILLGLEKTQLSIGARNLRTKLKTISRKTNELIDGFTSDHPMLNMVGGWYGEIADNVVQISQTEFQVAPFYYSSLFNSLQKTDVSSIKAVADLDDDTEDWKHGRHDLWLGVKERIFHIRWEHMFNDEELSSHIERFKEVREHIKGNSTVFLTTTRESETSIAKKEHPLGASAMGKHLLLIEPNLIGGYKHNKGRELLSLKVSNSNSFRRANDYYKSLKKKAIEVINGQEQELKKTWLQNHLIGVWDKSWNSKTELRNPRYFNDYDKHIRCWIPRYEKFIIDCAALVQQEIIRIYRKQNRSINLFELGYGTGALTSEIVSWICTLHKPFLVSRHRHPLRTEHILPVTRYLGIDRSDKMQNLALNNLSKKIPGYKDFIDVRLTAPHEFNNETERKEAPQADIICGTLVLHFLIGENADESQVIDLLEHLHKEWLADSGAIIFADVVFSDNREAQMAYWRNSMLSEGISENNVELFFKHNQDMTNAPSFNMIKSSAQSCGFSAEKFSVGESLSPFEVLILRKDLKNKD